MQFSFSYDDGSEIHCGVEDDDYGHGVGGDDYFDGIDNSYDEACCGW